MAQSDKKRRKALEYYEMAALFGYSPSLGRLGTLYRDGTNVTRDTSRATGYPERAAEIGNPEATVNLCSIYETGQNRYPKDIEKA